MHCLVLLFFHLTLFAQAIEWPKVIEAFLAKEALYPTCEIPGGASNKNYSITVDGMRYFIRCASSDAYKIYSSFDVEAEVLGKVALLGFTAKPLYLDPVHKVLVTEYIDHEEKIPDLLDPKVRQKVLEHLRQLQHSPICIERVFTPHEEVMRLVVQSENLSPAFCAKLQLLQEIDQVLAKIKLRALCHLDLHRRNLLQQGEKIWLVDWEFATMSHPFLSLSSMASIERWNDEQMKTLLEEYVGSPSLEEMETLYLYRIVADCFWTVWNHLQKQKSVLDAPYDQWEKLFEAAAMERLNSSRCQEAINHLKTIYG